MNISTHVDTLVIGARAAGAASAMLLARRGQNVLMLDRGSYGGDTRSTHALMRGAVLCLQRWGLLGGIERAGTPRVATTTFHYGEDRLPLAIKSRHGVDALYAPRRTLLDRLLVDAARDAGAEVHHRTRLLGLTRDRDGRVRGATVEDVDGRVHHIRASFVVGADGINSTVAREVDAHPYLEGNHASSVLYAYWSGLDVDAGYQWYYTPGYGAGIIPTNAGLSCVFVGCDPANFKRAMRSGVDGAYRELLSKLKQNGIDELRGGHVTTPIVGFTGRRGHMRPCAGPGWALVGDAGYFKDPITAHGITDAFRDAELASRAISAGTPAALAQYQNLRDSMSRPLFQLSDDIAAFDWDLATLQRWHRSLSEEMKHEATMLASLDADRAAA